MDDTEDSYVSFWSDEEENSPLETAQNRERELNQYRDQRVTVRLDRQGAPIFQIQLHKVRDFSNMNSYLIFKISHIL